MGEILGAQFWLIQAFNGISYGALLFLVGSGLSLIFGVMRIVNLSHGAYFLWGGYIALSVIWATGSWALSLPVAALAVAVIGLLMERVFLRPLGFRPAAAGAADGGLCLSVPAGRARHLGRQQLGDQSAERADAQRRDRRTVFAALPHVHDRDGAGDRRSRYGW